MIHTNLINNKYLKDKGYEQGDVACFRFCDFFLRTCMQAVCLVSWSHKNSIISLPPLLSTISLSFSAFTFLHQQFLLLWNIRIDLNVEAGSGSDRWPNRRTSICSIPPPNSKEIRWCWPRPLWECVRHCDSDLHDLQLLSSSKFLCFEHSGDLAQEIQMDFRKWKGEQKRSMSKKSNWYNSIQPWLWTDSYQGYEKEYKIWLSCDITFFLHIFTLPPLIVCLFGRHFHSRKFR